MYFLEGSFGRGNIILITVFSNRYNHLTLRLVVFSLVYFGIFILTEGVIPSCCICHNTERTNHPVLVLVCCCFILYLQ